MADVVAGGALGGALRRGGGAGEDRAAGGGLGVADIDEGEDARHRRRDHRQPQAGAGAAEQLVADHVELGMREGAADADGRLP